jgi:hypothetical protein
MTKKLQTVCLLLLTCGALSGCATGTSDRAVIGGTIGLGVGAISGNVGGAIAGAAVGAAIGAASAQ